MTRSISAKRMLDEAGIAATPGLDFDPVEGAQLTCGLSFAGTEEGCREGMRRLKAWLG